jgi:23S rRNA pseudouridine2605 synthase
MGGDVAKLTIAIAGSGDNFALTDQDGANGDLAARAGGFRFFQRTAHEPSGLSVHSLHLNRFDRIPTTMSGDASTERPAADKGERIAKRIARSGVCSRRDAGRLIAEGRVKLNGRVLATPAVTVRPADKIEVDGELLAANERTRLFLFNKPKGLVTTNKDPQGRSTVFSVLPREMPRVVTIGRLDISTEGLLLLTNDGGLARVLELPSTGWLRRYRVRAHGTIDQPSLDRLRRGVTIDGMVYGAVEAKIDRIQGSNLWLTVGLREGKNREVKRVLEHLGLGVNRLIRVSYGPFHLGELKAGEVEEVRGRVLREQLGEKLASAAGANFTAPIRPPLKDSDRASPPKRPNRDARRRRAL